MSKFDRFSDRAMDMADTVGNRIRQAMPSDVSDRIRHAMPSNIGDRVRRALPSRSGGILEAGVAIGALKTGGRVATTFARRNPAVMVAVVAGAGLLWYADHRRRSKKAERELLEGSSKRIEVTESDDASVSEI